MNEEESVATLAPKVFVRVSPPSKLEVAKRSKACLNVLNDGGSVTFFSPTGQEEYRYDFNQVFDENTNDNKIFKTVVEPMASNMLQGKNCAIISVGAGGSGKTRSLIGNQTFRPTDLNTQDGLESFEEGIIPSTTRELFELMSNSSSEFEFIIKVSFFEIHRDEVCDLINSNNRFLSIKDQDDGDQVNELFPKIEGLSEFCCVRASDILALLNKGHSNRLIRKEKYPSSSKELSTFFIIKIEQRNILRDCTQKSCFAFVNLSLDVSIDSSSLKETSLLNVLKSLDDYWKINIEPPSEQDIKSFRFAGSKLTRALQGALVGNCHTSYLLHLSNSSCSADKTFNSLRIGAILRNLKTCPRLQVQLSQKLYEEKLESYRKTQSEFMVLLREIKTEFDHIRGESDDELLNGSVWRELDRVCKNRKPLEQIEEFTESSKVPEAESIETLREKLDLVTKERDHANKTIAKLKEENSFLSMQCQDILRSKKNSVDEMMSIENEIHTLNQKRLEMEHNLRTSRFRENESVAFLRHIYRFYRRLLQNLLTQGSGDLKTIVENLLSAPDLSGLTDIADMLVESGLIETFEVEQDILKSDDYRPSKEALLRSSEYAQKMKSEQLKEPTLVRLKSTKEAIQRSLSMDKPILPQPKSSLSSVTKSPATKFAEKRLEDLESEHLKLSKENLEHRLRIAELEEKLNHLSSNQKKKPSKKQQQLDAIAIDGYKAELGRKKADLEGVIWKMNELHLINKSYKDKLWNRDQHIAYLDESLRREVDKNFNNVAIHTEGEKRLQAEVGRLNILIESLTTKLWKETESDSLLASRILIPIQGGIIQVTADSGLSNEITTKKGAKSANNVQIDRFKKNSSRFGESQSTLGARPTREVVINLEDEKGDEITLPDFPVLTSTPRENPEKPIPVFLFAGGKPYDHKPNIFSSKRGRVIKSATLKDNREEIQSKRERLAHLNETRQQLDRLEASVRRQT